MRPARLRFRSSSPARTESRARACIHCPSRLTLGRAFRVLSATKGKIAHWIQRGSTPRRPLRVGYGTSTRHRRCEGPAGHLRRMFPHGRSLSAPTWNDTRRTLTSGLGALRRLRRSGTMRRGLSQPAKCKERAKSDGCAPRDRSPLESVPRVRERGRIRRAYERKGKLVNTSADWKAHLEALETAPAKAERVTDLAPGFYVSAQNDSGQKVLVEGPYTHHAEALVRCGPSRKRGRRGPPVMLVRMGNGKGAVVSRVVHPGRFVTFVAPHVRSIQRRCWNRRRYARAQSTRSQRSPRSATPTSWGRTPIRKRQRGARLRESDQRERGRRGVQGRKGLA